MIQNALDSGPGIEYFPAAHRIFFIFLYTVCRLARFPDGKRPETLMFRLRATELLLPVGLMVCLLVILTPLPAAVLDLLLIGNIALSAIVLLTTIYVAAPLEFSVFPTVLLATTLGRLVLNVSTTRLILTEGASSGLSAAGGVIQSFGQFVAGDQVVVGVVMFCIIATIQFVVITKGATRISEVSARFALDGMPGKQMAVDADLQAGAIDEAEAHRRREEVSAAGGFLRGDGRGQQVRPWRCRRGRVHHDDQHRRWLGDWDFPIWDVSDRGGRGVHEIDDRRWIGQPDSRAVDFAGRGIAGNAEHAACESALSYSGLSCWPVRKSWRSRVFSSACCC